MLAFIPFKYEYSLKGDIIIPQKLESCNKKILQKLIFGADFTVTIYTLQTILWVLDKISWIAP